MNYEVFNCSVQGASHIRNDIPREDYELTFSDENIVIFAVADGHGDPNCLRSNIGSKLACAIAVRQLHTFADTLTRNHLEENILDEQRQPNIIKQLVYSIVGSWLEETNDNLIEYPLSEAEYEKAKRCADEYRAGIRTERIYGTTLIAGLLTEKYLLLLQQGDGHCDVFDSKGNVSQPIPWDDRCFGTATTSLCVIDAAESFRYCVIDLSSNPIIACVAGSDGVEDSFPTSMDKTHAYYRRLLSYACENGVALLNSFLPDELNRLSSSGSADDITVCGFIDIERTKQFLPLFNEQNNIVDLQDEYFAICEKINSIETGGKFEHLRRKYEEVMSRYTAAEARYSSATIEYNRVKNDLDSYCVSTHTQVDLSSTDEDSMPTSEKPEHNFSDNDTSDDGIIVSAKKHLRFHEHNTSTGSIEYLRRRLDYLFTQREIALKELQDIEEEKTSIEQEYIPYQQQYQFLLQKKAEAESKLNAINQISEN